MANISILTQTLQDRFLVPFGVRTPDVRSRFTSGIEEIDRLLQGGIPRASLSEISGPASSNRTALIVSVVARALEAGECAAWIDASGAFDPESAAAAGVMLNRLLWVNCGGNPERALKAIDLLLHGGGFGLIVFDLGDTPESVARRMPMASWFRLRWAAEQVGTAVIALTAAAQTHSCSAICVELKRTRSLWQGQLFLGIAAQLDTRKHNHSEKVSFESVL